ncbi:MAG TPA: flagellar biosynthetic protein FliR [Sulfurihydrogenibium sp.]|uniref:flagellar biosynthetic protein FliR n=1 Tax=Sulfurihydrogenibium sp. (strain YO3AOP1) TaxID=436114 RepID=UPI0001726706|nr:flagellar biosynthetic protein FliR [Sulfurihydrogenibium sp. YO3AOP1]ACD67230.1 flagellar biosynthetic protein FliR [Sulfurihydrogenibium sp. YO3AOP1]HBT98321.1 flagellar biosynthetic protein FliR [Sulfurihydrogenibium sp.]
MVLITPDQATTVALIFSRIIAFFMAFPLISSPIIPHNVKVLLVVSFAYFTMLNFNIKLEIKEYDLLVFLTLILKEVFIGFSLGIIVNIFIGAFSYAAEIISYLMGLTVLNMFNPAFGQTSVLSGYFLFLFYFLFFISGAYQIFIGALFKSFEVIPLSSFNINNGVFEFIIKKSSDIFLLSFQMAFPFILVLLVFNIVLALINRLIPQINVFMVGLPAQIFIGFVILIFASSLIISVGLNFIDKMTNYYLTLMEIFSR